MPIKMSQKTVVNIPHETGKCRVDNSRFNTFIKGCLKELKQTGETICFSKSQVEELKTLIEIERVEYDERNDCYYVFSKR